MGVPNKGRFQEGNVPWNKGLTKENDEIMRKISEKNKGQVSWNKGLTKETDDRVRKQSESNKGHSSWNTGLTKETDERLRKYGERIKKRWDEDPEYREKSSQSHLGLPGYWTGKKGPPSPTKGKKTGPRPDEVIKKIRLTTIKLIEKHIANGGQLSPNYNPAGCKLIDEYGKEHGYKFQHAENGGEFYIKELGYWVDGYDISTNTVIEIDEPAHYDYNGNLSKRDTERQAEIEDFLKCKFIRVKI